MLSGILFGVKILSSNSAISMPPNRYRTIRLVHAAVTASFEEQKNYKPDKSILFEIPI